MRHRNLLAVVTVLMVAVAVAAATRGWAFPQFARDTKAACVACHANPAGGADLTDAGKAYKADPTKPPAAAAGAEYVGANKCRMCHSKQHKAWLETKHAKALQMLKAADSTKVAAMSALLKVEITGTAAQTDGCVKCHVTGFQLPGGYPAADSARAAALSAVGCEACHGPGSKHVVAAIADKKKLINRNVTAKLCTQCHVAAMSPKFNFEEWKKKGTHLVPTTGS